MEYYREDNRVRAREFLLNGGWANPATQNTHITPALVDRAFKILHHFVAGLNQHLKAKNIPPVELGQPCGSTTYYKRDLVQNPEREYGDIDVNLFIPRIEDLSNNANADLIRTQVKEFCEISPDFQTSNGTNVIVKIDNNYVQVDFITAYYHNKEWTNALAPEYNVKGMLCNGLYSSLGEALDLSIGGGHGVQAKLKDNKLVPFRINKDIKLITVTNNPKSWAVDIVKFFGGDNFSTLLKQYPGMKDEIRVKDMIASIRGIAESLEINNKLPNKYNTASDLLQHIRNIYLGKISKAVESAKFEKAQTPSAIVKAQKTKELISTKGNEIANMIIF